MKKIVKNGLIGALFIGLITVCLFAFASTSSTVSADALELNGQAYRSKYILGSSISIPQAVLSYDGKEYNADGTVVYPSGKCLSADRVQLNETGSYTVEYKTAVQINGKRRNIAETLNFSVVSGTYSVSGEESTVVYGKDTSQYNLDMNGLTVNLQSGDTLNVNQPIDLNNTTSRDAICALSVLPTTKGSAEAMRVNVVLTDCYDPSNYITVAFCSGAISFGMTYDNIVYMGAGAYNQNIRGCSGKGTSYGMVPSNGQWTTFSMSGNGTKDSATTYLGFAMDYANKSIYSRTDSRNLLLAELTDLSVYEDIWNGFTTGEVFLSIQCDNYIGSSARLFVRDIFGMSLSDTVLVDENPPQLSIDFEGMQEDSLPEAVVNCRYPIYGCEAFDLLSEVKTKVSVWYNYYSENRYRVEIKNDEFLPTNVGLYTIEYVATDTSGNKTVKTVDIYCRNADEKIIVTLNDDGDSSGKNGETVKIKTFNVKNAVGEVKTEIVADLNGTLIDVKNYSFTPLQAGEYTIKYKLTDFVGQTAEISYDLTVNPNDKPIFLSEPVFEKYYIAGKAYTLPKVQAYDFESGTEIETEVYVNDTGTERRVLSAYIPQLNDAGEATVRYYVKTENGENMTDYYSIKIVETFDSSGKLDMEDYFMTDGLVANAASNRMTFAVKSENGVYPESASAEYIRAILSNNVDVKYSFDSNSKFNALTWYLTDKEDSDISISFSAVRNGSDNVMLYVNGKETIFPYLRTFEASEQIPFEISYVNSSCLLTDKNKIKYTIDETLNGEKFNGFPSGYVYIRFEISGITDSTTFNFYSMNGQPFNDSEYDTAAPNAYLANEYDPSVDLNSVVTIYSLVVSDMLDPQVSATVSVQKEDGTYVKTIDGVELRNASISQDMQVLFDSYGRYFITYTAQDSGYNSTPIYVTLQVRDVVAPEIVVEDNPYVDAQGVIHIPNATANDNIDGELDVLVYVEDSIGLMYKVSQDTYKTSGVGSYFVKYMAIDSSGNVTFRIFKIKVDR